MRKLDVGIQLRRNLVARACNRAAAFHASRFASVCSARAAKMTFTDITNSLTFYSRLDRVMHLARSRYQRGRQCLILSEKFVLFDEVTVRVLVVTVPGFQQDVDSVDRKASSRLRVFRIEMATIVLGLLILGPTQLHSFVGARGTG